MAAGSRWRCGLARCLAAAVVINHDPTKLPVEGIQADNAYKSLMAWIRQLRALTRNALKRRPDLMVKLDL